MTDHRRKQRRGNGRWIAGSFVLIAALVLLFAFLIRDGASPLSPIDRVSGNDARVTGGAEPDSGSSFVAAVRGALAGASGPDEPAAAESGAVAEEFRFFVAIEPPEFLVGDQSAIRAYQSIYSSFLKELSDIKGIGLIELETADQEFEPDELDFVLQVAGKIEAGADPLWSFAVSWEATRGGKATVTKSQAESSNRAIGLLGTDVAKSLRRYPFPPEEERTVELEAVALDISLPDEARFAALDELRDIPRRFELVGRDAQRIAAISAIEVVANSRDPRIRGRAWRAMTDADVDDDYLVGPVVDSLLHDPDADVRFEAIKLLSRGFRRDPRAQAALEYALANDASPQVKVRARWEVLDEDGRREQVRTTLLNPALSDAERLELLLADVNDLHSYVDRQRAIGLLSSAASFAEVQDDAAARGAVSPEMLLPLLTQLLVESENEEIRATAASMLVRHADDERAREALEQAATDDSSYTIRMLISRALRR